MQKRYLQFFPILVILIIRMGHLSGQNTKTVYWVTNLSGSLHLTNSNQDLLASPVPDIENFLFSTSLFRSVSSHFMTGISLFTQLEPRFQFYQTSFSLRYYPISIEHTVLFFFELSPGVAWNRNIYSIPLGCTSCAGQETYSKGFFYPLGGAGLSWRPQNYKVSFDGYATYHPSYNAGPFHQKVGNDLKFRAGFSYWITH